MLAGPLAVAAPLEPTPGESATAKVIVEGAAAQHYRNRPVDTALSSDIHDHLIAALDPGREILSIEDVVGFEKYRSLWASALRDGDLTALFELYSAFRARFDDRLSYAQGLLGGDLRLDGYDEIAARGADVPWSSRQGLDDLWSRRVRNDLLVLLLGGVAHGDAVEVLHKRYAELLARAEARSADDVFQILVDAYLHSLDPHSEYFLPRRAQPAGNGGAPEGIGVQLKLDREYVAVRRLFDGGAADRDGRLHAGDRILAVGEGASGRMVDVIGWTLDPVVDLIRGAEGTTVRLLVMPRGTSELDAPALVGLVRSQVKLQEQGPKKSCHKVTGVRVCAITIPRFYIDYAGAGRGGADYAGTAADVARLLNEEERRPEGVVLDLRGNSGGALLEAARLAGLFIDFGTMVQVKHANGDIEQFPDPVPGSLYDGPLMVLVDRYSASATEIFAAAIQDYRRGSIVGEHTFGKGTVQETVDLNDSEGDSPTFGQLVLTTAEYFRVTGKSTQLGGVEAEVTLPAWPGAGDYGERFESNPLPPDQVAPVSFTPAANAVLVSDTARALHEDRMRLDRGLQAVMAAAAERRTDAAASLSLNERRRREVAARRVAADRALGNALREAVSSTQVASDAPPEALWRELMLVESERILADSIHASR
jgi:carboxyl-terminal processing protease